MITDHEILERFPREMGVCVIDGQLVEGTLPGEREVETTIGITHIPSKALILCEGQRIKIAWGVAASLSMSPERVLKKIMNLTEGMGDFVYIYRDVKFVLDKKTHHFLN